MPLTRGPATPHEPKPKVRTRTTQQSTQKFMERVQKYTKQHTKTVRPHGRILVWQRQMLCGRRIQLLTQYRQYYHGKYNVTHCSKVRGRRRDHVTARRDSPPHSQRRTWPRSTTYRCIFLWKSSHLSHLCGRNGGIKSWITNCTPSCPKLMTSISRDAQIEKMKLLLIAFEQVICF